MRDSVKKEKLNIERINYPYKGLRQEMLVCYTQKETSKSIIYIHGHRGNSYTSLWRPGGFIRRNDFIGCYPTLIGYGNSEGEADFNGSKTIEAVSKGIEVFLDSPEIDKENVSIWGVSRGASVVAQIITKNKFKFKSAILQAGMYDYHEGYYGKELKKGPKKEDYEREIGEIKEETLEQRSVINKVNNIKTKVLLLHGEKDENVDVVQARLMDKALKENKIEHKTVIIKEADHYLGKYASEYVIPFIEN